ncbi:hypothetical protein V8B97DRAFT_1985737 [Scleroderma yunnanense]
MGFCRRCGDIVSGQRCKCGGTAVAPVVQWSSPKGPIIDKWSQTYVSRETSPTRSPIQLDSNFDESPSFRRFLRSNTVHMSSPPSSNDCSDSNPVPASLSSPLGRMIEPHGIGSSAEPSVFEMIQKPSEPELSKVYGSVLQPKETLATFSCAICSAEFQPDAIIYPDPSSLESSDRFLCKPCFVVGGGSKGDCPNCHRPVLILKSEGGFVEAAGEVWHKRCFCCSGCQKNIGDTPMVDLLGRPSCPDCFDSCLKRTSTPKKPVQSNSERGERSLSPSFHIDLKSQRDSPAVDQLERRSFVKGKEGSPVLEELTQRLNAVLNRTSRDSSPSFIPLPCTLPQDSYDSSPLAQRTLRKDKLGADSSPSPHGGNDFKVKATGTGSITSPSRSIHEQFGTPDRNRTPSSGRPSFDAIEEMKRRFMNQSNSVPVSDSQSPRLASPNLTPSRIPRISSIANGSPTLRHVVSTSSLRSPRMSWTPSTPDLVPDVCDTMTQSSGPSSPPAFSPNIHSDSLSIANKECSAHAPDDHPSLTGTMMSKQKESIRRLSIPTATLSPGSLCAKCGGSLFASGGTGRFVTVPELNTTGPPKTYHTECFRCVICDGRFKESPNGKAVFVRNEGGACHLECAPPEQAGATSTVVSSPIKSTFTDTSLSIASPRGPVGNTIPKSTMVTTKPRPRIQEKGFPSVYNSPTISSRYERASPSPSAVQPTHTRFGSSTACPGCLKSVSPMEFGVVPGPQGSRWHATCLVCGGKGANKGRRDKSQPGCAKKLDSAAKRDIEGGVWCRECLLLLPAHSRNPVVEKPLVPMFTGRSTGGDAFSKVTPQITGTTTIARQFTGLRTGDGVMRQLTGGGLSPTRQLAGSPTKQIGLATPRPRPKSVIGMRSGKSVDEGRGMFLVRQMTGGGPFGV